MRTYNIQMATQHRMRWAWVDTKTCQLGLLLPPADAPGEHFDALALLVDPINDTAHVVWLQGQACLTAFLDGAAALANDPASNGALQVTDAGLCIHIDSGPVAVVGQGCAAFGAEATTWWPDATEDQAQALAALIDQTAGKARDCEVYADRDGHVLGEALSPACLAAPPARLMARINGVGYQLLKSGQGATGKRLAATLRDALMTSPGVDAVVDTDPVPVTPPPEDDMMQGSLF